MKTITAKLRESPQAMVTIQDELLARDPLALNSLVSKAKRDVLFRFAEMLREKAITLTENDIEYGYKDDSNAQ